MLDGSIGTASGNGNLNLDTVFTNVAVHYWF